MLAKCECFFIFLSKISLKILILKFELKVSHVYMYLRQEGTTFWLCGSHAFKFNFLFKRLLFPLKRPSLTFVVLIWSFLFLEQNLCTRKQNPCLIILIWKNHLRKTKNCLFKFQTVVLIKRSVCWHWEYFRREREKMIIS